MGKRLAGTYELDKEALAKLLIAKANREDLPAEAEQEEKQAILAGARQEAASWHMEIVLAANQTFTAQTRMSPKTPLEVISGSWTLSGKKLSLEVRRVDGKQPARADPIADPMDMTWEMTWEDGQIRIPPDGGLGFVLVRQ